MPCIKVIKRLIKSAPTGMPQVYFRERRRRAAGRKKSVPSFFVRSSSGGKPLEEVGPRVPCSRVGPEEVRFLREPATRFSKFPTLGPARPKTTAESTFFFFKSPPPQSPPSLGTTRRLFFGEAIRAPKFCKHLLENKIDRNSFVRPFRVYVRAYVRACVCRATTFCYQSGR